MHKIKNISFIDHPVLGNLTLDFCDRDGNIVDTVILAGENGTGKSTVMQALYKFATGNVDFECQVTFLTSENEEAVLNFKYDEKGRVVPDDQTGKQLYQNIEPYKSKYTIPAIYSDVNNNFDSQPIRNVTSSDIDTNASSRQSDSNLPTKINQLLIDLDNDDARRLKAEYKKAIKENQPLNDLKTDFKLERFTKSFNAMFDDLSFNCIENQKNHLEILFQRKGENIPIENLSSGEKQIVYRGSFLLQDKNAMEGALIFIDEPETSMHPRWQEKIMDFYKGIFTNDEGVQTSQIFVATHSPFIIHNENRKNDKVIVLKRNNNCEITVEDKPEYYKCTSVEAVEDAFSVSMIKEIVSEKSTVFLEGETDEMYYNRALEVFGYDNLPFQFKWIGTLGKNGKPVNSGQENVRKASELLRSMNLSIKNFCLFDCDAKMKASSRNNVISLVMPYFKNNLKINKGIENALVIDSDFMDMHPFYLTHEKCGDYGEKDINQSFEKTKFCKELITKSDEELKPIFIHLKEEIDRINKLYTGELNINEKNE